MLGVARQSSSISKLPESLPPNKSLVLPGITRPSVDHQVTGHRTSESIEVGGTNPFQFRVGATRVSCTLKGFRMQE